MPLLVLCGIQIIYGSESQPFKYILSMLVHFLPKEICVVFVYMNSDVLVESPTNALLLMCATFPVLKTFS